MASRTKQDSTSIQTQQQSKPEPDFSIEALLDELGQAEEGSGLSTWELAEKCNRSESWVQRKLKRLARVGRLKVERRRAKDLTDNDIWTPVYRLKKNEEAG